ncbi:hypothetical protein ACFC6L_20335 [Kitasatospora phosalacinea]|uniref:hypothetical protein n=1 Tax=Kitasatospora phosalacinea TaxID=2065 RepID=UPI0035D9AEF7
MPVDLQALTLDWTDFEKAGAESRAFLRELVEDKALLRELVYRIEDRPDLLAMCERHQLLDYIVVEDALDRGFRLRIHLSTQDHLDRPHDHRFSFSSLIVTGGYEHTWHHPVRALYDASGADDTAVRHQSVNAPDLRDEVGLGDLVPYVTRREEPGACYTLHHSTIHTTFTTPDTVSIFLRGPAEKDRSIIFDRETGRLWWRYGQQAEPEERRRSKPMSLEEYREFRTRLEKLGVI